MIRLVATQESREAAELREFIRQIRRPGRNQRRAVAGAVRQGIAANFTAQSAGDGAAWAPLAEFTVEDRRSRGYAGRRPILVRSGDYRGSLVDAGHPDHSEIWEFGGEGWSVEIGSDKTVGRHNLDAILQGGANIMVYGRTPARIPPRPTTILAGRARDRIGDVLDHIMEQLEP